MKNDLSKLNLFGNVKILTETVFKAFNDILEIKKGDKISKKIIQFNEYGNMIECNTYKSDSRLDNRITYHFDENENLIEAKIYKKYELSEDFYLYSIEKFNYDKKGNLIEKEFSDTKAHSYYKNDEKGNIIEERFFDMEDELDSFIINKYDNKGNRIIMNNYTLSWDKHFNITYKRIFKYNDNGNMIKESQYHDIAHNNAISIYNFDERYNKIEEDWLPIDRKIYPKKIDKYKYDEKGNRIERFSYSRFHKSTWTCVYNYIYDYDKFNNWIKQIEIKNDFEPQKIIEREIEYY